MNKMSYLLFFICCLTACQTTRKGTIDFSGETLFLKKTDLLVKDSFLLGDYDVIPLELNAYSAIKQIDKLFLFEDKIGVLDLDLRALFIFNHQGKFLYEISHIGNGPGEYSQLMDVCIDPVDSCFAFLTAQHAIMFYSYDGEFKYSVKIEKTGQRMALKDDYIYLMVPDKLNYDKQDSSIMAINRRNGKTVYLLEQGIRPVESLWTNGYSLISGKDAVYYLQRFTHRLYQVKGETCTPFYELDLGKFELPDYLMEEGVDRQFFSREWSRLNSVFSLTNLCELSTGFLLCSNTIGFFYYNSKEKVLNHLDGIKNDEYEIEFSHAVPVEPVGDKVAFILGEYAITSRKEWRKKSDYRQKRETPALKELMDRLPDDSNPVLFLYSVK